MFSYLRSNNRRSALPPAANLFSPSSRHVHSLQGPTEEPSTDHAYQPSPSPISPDPPVLPPIPRVASQHESSQKYCVEKQPMYEADPTQEQRQTEQGTNPSRLKEPHSVNRIDDEQHPTSSKSPIMRPPPHQSQQNPQSQNWKTQPPPHASSESVRSHPEPFSKHTKSRNQEQTNKGTQPARAPPPPPLKISSGPGGNRAQARQGRTKLNLLNPMALLARRRSHQAITDSNAEKAQYKGTYPPVLGIPDDFDPRIRGNVVHDFSAPRPGTTESSNRARGSNRQREAILYNSRRPSPNASTSFPDDDSPSSSEREHTPQFKEHFDEDFEPLKDGPAKQRTSAFMYQVSLSESQPDPDPSVLPPFARHLPPTISTASIVEHKPSSPPPKQSLYIVPESSITGPFPPDNPLASAPPSSPPVKARSRASSNTDPSYQPAGLPKHFKSNASRFSFDLTGVGSAAQEKILEDKHRQHEKNKARRSDDSQLSATDVSSRDADDDQEYADEYDDLVDGDSLEEKIPGVNTDADEPTAQDIDFVSPCKSSSTSDPSLVCTGVTSPDIPLENMGIPLNLNASSVSSGLAYSQALHAVQPPSDDILEYYAWDLAHANNIEPTYDPGSGLSSSTSARQDNDEDDLYFDDGMIEGLDLLADHAFDESVFDDDTDKVYGVPLREQRPKSEDIAVATNGQKSGNDAYQNFESNEDGRALPKKTSPEVEKPFEQLDRDTRHSFSQSTDLSDNAAYLDALAVGINQAALDGKLNRWLSLRPKAEKGFENTTEPSGPHVQYDAVHDAKPVTEAEDLLIGSGIQDSEELEFDDALADDSIIAAANAEALENDEEGFYGQEFGFFARASGAGEAEYANGGYFGSRGGFEGIGRSHSGRNNEPSLTPITERSEWSNRNSAISLAMHGFQQPHSAGTQPSAGLAQLADLMHLEDDDLSFSALMKLRRGAWGGSNASLSNSSNGNANIANGSPLTMYTSHNHASSSYSLGSSNGFASSPDDSQPSPTSATITFSAQQQALPMQQPPQSAPAFLPQQQQFMQQYFPVLSPSGVTMSQQTHRRSMSPVKRSSMGPPSRPTKGHSRNSSNASESVSYVHEAGGDDGGQGRWVLEKRRTDGSGMVEVLGREFVEGGRI